MKIYVYEVMIRDEIHFCVKEYDVIEEDKEYYLRKNDGHYSEVYTFKKFDKDFARDPEYGHEDECLDFPLLHSMSNERIGAIMPSLSKDSEKAKEKILKEIEKYYQKQMTEMNKTIAKASQFSDWEEYEPTYEWEEE